MAATKWVVVNKTWCDRVDAEAVLMEQRVFPDDILPETLLLNRVIGREAYGAVE